MQEKLGTSTAALAAAEETLTGLRGRVRELESDRANTQQNIDLQQKRRDAVSAVRVCVRVRVRECACVRVFSFVVLLLCFSLSPVVSSRSCPFFFFFFFARSVKFSLHGHPVLSLPHSFSFVSPPPSPPNRLLLCAAGDE